MTDVLLQELVDDLYSVLIAIEDSQDECVRAGIPLLQAAIEQLELALPDAD